jgi:hypothetical protein
VARKKVKVRVGKLVSKKISRKQARDMLWARGNLRWLLRPEQQEIYDLLRSAEGLKYTLYISRRFGKSFICRLMAHEDGLRNKNWQVGFVAPTQKQLKRIFGPIDRKILATCPAHLRPKPDRDAGALIYPSTKTVLYESGTDNQRYEDLVGMNAHRCYYDEPGSMTDLDKIVYDIIQPQTLTTKDERGGSVAQIFLGTPKEKCKSENNYAKKTVYDNSSLNEETIRLYMDESGGEDSTSWRREYLCEDVVDSDIAVVPEFDDLAEQECVKDFDDPDYFVLYGALDPGHLNDKLGYVLGYYDFANACYRIRADLKMGNKPTDAMNEDLRKLEDRIYPNKKVQYRYSDTESQIIRDLNLIYDLEVIPTAKDNKFAQINKLRNLIKQRRILFHTDCKDLTRQLRTAIWDSGKKKFEYSNEDGHFDLVDSVLYLIRNIDEFHNPYPGAYDHLTTKDHFIRREDKHSNDALRVALGVE